MKSIHKSTILTALILFTVPMLAQTKRIPISIVNNCSDPVCQTFAYSLKDQLTRSGVFQYNDDTEHGFQLSLVCVDEDAGTRDAAKASAISIVFIGNSKDDWPSFLDQWLFVVGAQRTDDMAKQLLARVNSYIDKINAEFKKRGYEVGAPKSY